MSTEPPVELDDDEVAGACVMSEQTFTVERTDYDPNLFRIMVNGERLTYASSDTLRRCGIAVPAPPPMPEPDHSLLVLDVHQDAWLWDESPSPGWYTSDLRLPRSWPELLTDFAPLTVWEPKR